MDSQPQFTTLIKLIQQQLSKRREAGDHQPAQSLIKNQPDKLSTN